MGPGRTIDASGPHVKPPHRDTPASFRIVRQRRLVIVASRRSDEALRPDPEVADPAAMPGCPAPYPEGLMTAYPVSTAVNAVGNDGPELIAPAPS
jgi:putative SOS response-associated peptidase YedK